MSLCIASNVKLETDRWEGREWILYIAFWQKQHGSPNTSVCQEKGNRKGNRKQSISVTSSYLLIYPCSGIALWAFVETATSLSFSFHVKLTSWPITASQFLLKVMNDTKKGNCITWVCDYWRISRYSSSTSFCGLGTS